MSEMRAVGVAMSGGGFRATAWGLGVMIGLVRAREMEVEKGDGPRQGISVVSIASVSGGSIANAALAMRLSADVDDISVDDLLDDVGGVARHVAFEGLIRYAAATNAFVAVTF